MRFLSSASGTGYDPLHRDIEACGAMHSLRRTLDELKGEFKQHFKKIVRSMPAWALDAPFRVACSLVTARDAMEYARRFQRMRRFLAVVASSEAQLAMLGECVPPRCSENMPVDVDTSVTIERALAVARLSLGSLLEDYCTLKALRICQTTCIPTAADEVIRFSRVCIDGYFVALWTDMHSHYIVNVLGGAVERTVGRTVVVRGTSLGAPDVRMTYSVSSLPRLSMQLQDTLSGRTPSSERCKAIVVVLQRCIQSGSRGWDGALENALSEEHTRSVCNRVLISCMAGMHPQIHPASRPSWERRVELTTILRSKSVERHLVEAMKRCTVLTKECMRIYACSIMDSIPATRSGLAHAGHVMGGLRSCPHGMAPTSLQAAAHCIASAGLDIASLWKAPPGPDAILSTLCDVMLENIGSEPRSRKRAQLKERRSHGILLSSAVSSVQKLSYSSSWLNRITHTGLSFAVERPPNRRKRNSHPHSGAPGSRTDATQPGDAVGEQAGDCEAAPQTSATSVISVVSSMFSRCFNATFIPWWTHAHCHGVRSARLDISQYNHMHFESPVYRMRKEMTDEDVVAVQRAVMEDKHASVMTAYEAACLLGVDGAGLLRTAATLDDAIVSITKMGARDACMLMEFARFASLKEETLAFDLGASARNAQIDALRLRFDIDASFTRDEVVMALPDHAKKLYWCLECHSVSNARVDLNARFVSHNEVGVSQTMLYVGGVCEASSIRCAKRSSAALRTAMQKENDAKHHRVESFEVSEEKLAASLSENSDASHCARLRRDIKACAEQGPCTVACGDGSMAQMDILGKAARVLGKWYTICFFCGSIFIVTQRRRYSDGMCCCRCDAGMLSSSATRVREKGSSSLVCREAAPSVHHSSAPAFCGFVSTKQLPCRYCAKPPPQNDNNRFKILKCPLDDGGRNQFIPPPLRVCAYCPAHYRNWMEWACIVMDTRVIFAHIAEKAIPTFGADGAVEPSDPGERLLSARPVATTSKFYRQLTKRMRIASSTHGK